MSVCDRRLLGVLFVAVGAVIVATLYLAGATRMSGHFEGMDENHELFETLKANAEIVDDQLIGEHICSGIVDKDFPDRCERLIAELASRCEVSLDGSLESLESLERQLIKMYGLFVDEDFEAIQRDVFPGLLAYSGQVVINRTNGNWEIVKTDNGVFEPWVVSDDRRFEIMGILKAFYEDQDSFSLSAELEAILSTPLLRDETGRDETGTGPFSGNSK